MGEAAALLEEYPWLEGLLPVEGRVGASSSSQDDKGPEDPEEDEADETMGKPGLSDEAIDA
eukprot:791765-Lingulodinium_polyedra.AAC.1